MESDLSELTEDEAGWLRVLAVRAWVDALEVASVDPEVLEFRRGLPDGKLLPRSKVLSWAARIAEREGASTVVRQEFAGASGARGFRPEIVEVSEQLAIEFTRGEPIPMRADGTLGRLSAIAHRLAARFAWHVDQTAEWILTGRRAVSLASWGHVMVEHGEPSAFVTIRVPAELPGSYVARLHRDARRDVAKRERHFALKGAPVGFKQLSVMSFCAQRNDGRSWESMLSEWHEKRCGEHPDWRYKSFRNFSRDVRDTYQRVMGRPWIHGGRSGGDDAEA